MGNRIRELREERRMTQVRLSIELEVSQETISSYENERHYPSYTQLVKMSGLFHASIDYIMGLSPVRNPVEQPENSKRDHLINLVRQLSSRQIDLVSAYTRGVLAMGWAAETDE